jgi:hypothetical protein
MYNTLKFYKNQSCLNLFFWQQNIVDEKLYLNLLVKIAICTTGS